MPTRIVLAEDSFIVREGVAHLIESVDELDLVDSCADYDSLMEAVELHRPDVVLTDIRMPPTGTDKGIRALTISADGTTEREVVGASTFPCHWIYDAEGRLASKSGLIDFKDWMRSAFGKHTPWGDEESPALVTAVESALERELSTSIMRGGPSPSSAS